MENEEPAERCPWPVQGEENNAIQLLGDELDSLVAEIPPEYQTANQKLRRQAPNNRPPFYLATESDS